MKYIIFYDLVKSRHSRAGGNPGSAKLSKRLESRFHGNDGKAHFNTSYEVIIFDDKFVLDDVMATGVEGFGLKRRAAIDPIPAIREILQGSAYLSQDVQGR